MTLTTENYQDNCRVYLDEYEEQALNRNFWFSNRAMQEFWNNLIRKDVLRESYFRKFV